MAKTKTHQLPIAGGVKVFCCEMRPAAESTFLTDLIAHGIGAVDYSTGASLEPKDAPKNNKAASQSFRTLRELGQNIGYGVVADRERENVIVGRTTPPCMTVFEAPSSNKGTVTLKGFQFDKYGFVTEDKYSNVFDVVKNRQGVATLTSVRSEESGIKGPGRESVIDAFHRLEETGELIQPPR